jgi:hypothetical protein
MASLFTNFRFEAVLFSANLFQIVSANHDAGTTLLSVRTSCEDYDNRRHDSIRYTTRFVNFSNCFSHDLAAAMLKFGRAHKLSRSKIECAYDR